jgi:outer membrane receptor protein involved in Fe transport
MLVPACTLLAAFPALAQQASTDMTPDAATLAKYDKNHDGKLDADEIAVMQADQAKAAKAAIESPNPTQTKDGVVTLSPFDVNADDEKGYAASSSLSGTRLRSSLEDISGSVSVVTKQQLEDTASIDINDIFQYEVGTQGTAQYTNTANDGRSGNDAQDNTQGNPTGSNRMRGLSQANIAVGGFTASSSIPIDTYNISAVEISRGPNSNLAGLSDAGGTVNLITNGANLSRETTGATLRGDSYGGFRTTIDINRPIIRNKLALRFSAVYNETGYVRKPSVDRTNRQQMALTYAPFRTTRISASVEGFHEWAQRANSLTPRNSLDGWIANGRPTYDPVTNTSTVNGTTITGLAPGLSGLGSSNVRILQYIDGGTINYMEHGNIGAVATLGVTAEQFSESSSDPLSGGSLFHAFGVTNKAFYDWTKINMAAPNYEIQGAQIENVSLEQSVLNTPRQQLDLQMAWRREDQSDYRRMFLGQTDGLQTLLEVDTNSRLLDGRPNPFFLHPFVGGVNPQVYTRPLFTDSYRWQLAYQINMKQEKNIFKWLGQHKIVAYQESVLTKSAPNSLRYHDAVVDNTDFQPGLLTLTPTSNLTGNAGALVYPLYYFGNVPGQGVKYANTGPVNPNGKYNASYFNPTTGVWNLNDPVNLQEIYFSQVMQKKKLRTSGITMQSFLYNDQIIPTLGVREDRVYTEDGFGASLNNGFYDETHLSDFGLNKKYNSGKTRSKGVVVKPFRGLGFIQREAQSTGIGSYFAEAIRGFNVVYNRSDSFVPADTAYNVFLQQLPNPAGRAEEYGFSLNMFGKFSLTLKHQDTIQFHTRSTLGVVASRAIGMDFQIPGEALTFDLYDAATGWQEQLHPEFSLAQAQAAAAKQIGYTTDYIASASGKTISDANDAESKGYELELQFNPSKYWTVKVTGAQQVAIDSNISVYLSEFINQRLPYWTTVTDPTGALWWTTPNGSNGAPVNYFNPNILSPLTIALASQGLAKPQTSKYTYTVLSNYRLAGLAGLGERFSFLKAISVGGAYRWQSQAAIGYYGSAPDPTTGVITTLDRTKPFYNPSVGHLDFTSSYRTKLFSNRIGTTFQLNVKDVTENGHLLGVSVNPDGRYWNYRIIDPRQFIFTVSMDL